MSPVQPLTRTSSRVQAELAPYLAAAWLVFLAGAVGYALAYGAITYGPDGWVYEYVLALWKQSGWLHHDLSGTYYPHFVYLVLLRFLNATLFPKTDYITIYIGLSTTISVTTAAVYYAVLYRAVGWSKRDAAALWVVVGSVALILATPINLLSVEAMNLKWGYMTPTHHNPPVNMVRPMMIIALLTAIACFKSPRGRWLALQAAAISLLAAVTKSNFSLGFLPALTLIAGWRLLRRETVHWGALVGGILIPVGIVVAIQTMITVWGVPGIGGGIAVEPLCFHHRMNVYQPAADDWIAGKLLLTTLFPWVVYGLHWRAARHDLALNGVWVFFAVCTLINFNICETGLRWTHGNFLWNGELGVTALMVFSLRFLFQQHAEAFQQWAAPLREWRCGLALLVLLLHVISGVFWAWLNATTDILKWL